jgi:hypothetical protein
MRVRVRVRVRVPSLVDRQEGLKKGRRTAAADRAPIRTTE